MYHKVFCERVDKWTLKLSQQPLVFMTVLVFYLKAYKFVYNDIFIIF